MNQIFPTGETEHGFSIFLPPEDMNQEEAMKNVRSCNRINAEISRKRITASFVYAHPADYRGRFMVGASERDWERLFDELSEMHMDSVIFQASLWKELNECYYRSRRFSSMKIFDVAEKMLSAAEKKHFTVYLGGYGTVSGWAERVDEAQLREEIRGHRECFRELCGLGKFAGMYFPAETGYLGKRDAEKEKRMNYLYRHFSDMVKEHDSSLKVITSPAAWYHPGKENEFLDFWDSILRDSRIDILMPQDVIGNALYSLDHISSMWNQWKTAADRNGLVLWAHIELFERRSYMEKTNLYPASPERVAVQIAHAAPVAEKLCCWEAPYFATEASGPDGKRLGGFLKKSQTKDSL